VSVSFVIFVGICRRIISLIISLVALIYIACSHRLVVIVPVAISPCVIELLDCDNCHRCSFSHRSFNIVMDVMVKVNTVTSLLRVTETECVVSLTYVVW